MHIRENTHTEHENAELSRTRHYGVQVTACVFLMCCILRHEQIKKKKYQDVLCLVSQCAL